MFSTLEPQLNYLWQQSNTSTGIRETDSWCRSDELTEATFGNDRRDGRIGWDGSDGWKGGLLLRNCCGKRVYWLKLCEVNCCCVCIGGRWRRNAWGDRPPTGDWIDAADVLESMDLFNESLIEFRSVSILREEDAIVQPMRWHVFKLPRQTGRWRIMSVNGKFDRFCFWWFHECRSVVGRLNRFHRWWREIVCNGFRARRMHGQAQWEGRTNR